jgi:hypothetical protein
MNQLTDNSNNKNNNTTSIDLDNNIVEKLIINDEIELNEPINTIVCDSPYFTIFPRIRNIEYPEMKCANQFLVFFLIIVYTFIICLIPYIIKQATSWPMYCTSDNNWNNIKYDKEISKSCEESCSTSSYFSKKALKLYTQLFQSIGYTSTCYYFFHCKFSYIIVIFFVACVVLNVVVSIFSDLSSFVKTYQVLIFNLGLIISDTLLALLYSKYTIVIISYVSLILIVGGFYLTFYEYVFIHLFKMNLISSIIYLNLFSVVINFLFSLTIKNKYALLIHPLYKVFFGFCTYSYLKGFSVGMLIVSIQRGGIGSYEVILSFLLSIISELASFYRLITKLNYLVLNFFKTIKLKVPEISDIEQIMLTMSSHYELLCISVVILSYFTKNAFHQDMLSSVVDCYGTLNYEKYFNLTLVQLVFVIFYFCLKFFIVVTGVNYISKKYGLSEKRYIPDANSKLEIFILVSCVGYNTYRFIYGGFFVSLQYAIFLS